MPGRGESSLVESVGHSGGREDREERGLSGSSSLM